MFVFVKRVCEKMFENFTGGEQGAEGGMGKGQVVGRREGQGGGRTGKEWGGEQEKSERKFAMSLDKWEHMCCNGLS